MVSGVPPQADTGVRKIQCAARDELSKVENRKHIAEDKGQTVFVICCLTPDTRNLTPKI
jgi:hypothetical protein